MVADNIKKDKAQAYSKGGHTDFGSLTLLFSQHIAGLQILTPEGEWKYVKPSPGGITTAWSTQYYSRDYRAHFVPPWGLGPSSRRETGCNRGRRRWPYEAASSHQVPAQGGVQARASLC